MKESFREAYTNSAMGYYDRPYYRDEISRTPMSRFTGHSVVIWLLGINVVVFLIDGILFGSRRAHALAPTTWGAYSFSDAILGFEVWRLFTYQFIHANLFHILFNMLGLYFIGPLVEQWWGPRKFLAFYLLSGMGGALLFSTLGAIPGLVEVAPDQQLVGASGAIFGILVGAAVAYPNLEVTPLFLPFRLKMRTFALIFMGIIFLSLLAGSVGAPSEAAHLGGAVIGFVLMKWPRTLNMFERFQLPRLAKWRQKRRQKQLQRQREREDHLEAEVDRILAKVNREGLHSLNRRERRTLQEATESKRRGW